MSLQLEHGNIALVANWRCHTCFVLF